MMKGADVRKGGAAGRGVAVMWVHDDQHECGYR